MRVPYSYVLVGDRLVVQEDQADVVRMIFNYYLSGASLGKVADKLKLKGIVSPTGKANWTRATIDKILSNAKYIPIVGVEKYMDVQFEKDRRCNIDYDQAGNPRKSTRYQSSVME